MGKSIAILLTSNDTSAFAARHPDDGEKFRRLLQPLRPDWRFDTVSVKDNVFPDSPEQYDGYVITGSPASVLDKDPWIGRLFEFIRQLDERRIPTVGACFGHQAIALALGGKVASNPGGWSIGTETTQYRTRMPWMNGHAQTLTLFSAHKQQVTEPPASAEILGGNEFCPAAAMVIGDHIFTTEYHPEMTPDFIGELLGEMSGYVDAETLARARQQIEAPTDGAVFAQWMVDFFDFPRES